jgi:hypothetical protein
LKKKREGCGELAENIQIMLAGKAIGRRHRITPKNSVLGKVCPMANDKKAIPAVQEKTYATSLVTFHEDDMLLLTSKMTSIFFGSECTLN